MQQLETAPAAGRRIADRSPARGRVSVGRLGDTSLAVQMTPWRSPTAALDMREAYSHTLYM